MTNNVAPAKTMHLVRNTCIVYDPLVVVTAFKSHSHAGFAVTDPPTGGFDVSVLFIPAVGEGGGVSHITTG
jgi:hypothetical protein